MAYEKQKFEDGQVLEAEHLNHMEDELARQKSWNELGDRPFYEKITAITEIIPETEVVGSEESGGTVDFDSSKFPEEPDVLLIRFDAVDYVCNKTSVAGSAFYGNFALGGGDNTGEPFLFMLSLADASAMMLLQDTSSHMVSISSPIIEVEMLPAKFVTKVFYVSNADQYLYKDIGLLNKATAEDIAEAVAASACKVSFVLPGASYVFGVFTPLVINNDDLNLTAAIHLVNFNGTGASVSTTPYYTAEYTPPET